MVQMCRSLQDYVVRRRGMTELVFCFGRKVGFLLQHPEILFRFLYIQNNYDSKDGVLFLLIVY